MVAKQDKIDTTIQIILYTVSRYVCPVIMCVFTFLFPCCIVSYVFHAKAMFDSSLPLVVSRRAHVLFRMFDSSLPLVVSRRAHILLCVCFVWLPIVMSNNLLLLIFLVFCVVYVVLFIFVLCLVYPMLPVSLDCSILIAPSVFSNFYLYI